jgi:hypothetical protein
MATRRTQSRSPLQPAPPPTHLSPRPTRWELGNLGWGYRVLRLPLAPWPRSPRSEGQSVRRRRPAVPATCPKFGARSASCARCPLPGSSGYAPPGRPAQSALPAAVRAAVAPCVPPAAAASAVTEPRAGHPGFGCHSAPTSRRARQRAAPTPRSAPPPPRPRRPIAEPAGKRSPSCSPARHAGIRSPLLLAKVHRNLELLFHFYPFPSFLSPFN